MNQIIGGSTIRLVRSAMCACSAAASPGRRPAAWVSQTATGGSDADVCSNSCTAVSAGRSKPAQYPAKSSGD